MPPAKRASPKVTRAPEKFELRDDGTVFVQWRGLPDGATLEPPLIGEYEAIVLKYERTRDWYTKHEARDVFSTKAPNAEIWVDILKTLAGVDVEAAQLATWMLAGISLTRLIVNWRVNPLARGETEDLVAQATRAMVEQLQGMGNPATSNLPSSPASEAN